MVMVFGPDDSEDFEAARDSLIERFERWLHTDGGLARKVASSVATDASVALDWKFSYGDGNMVRWTVGEVAEFLLEWCPRKLSVSPDDAASIPRSVAVLFDFLGEAGLLAPGSSPADALIVTAVSMAEEFVAEMGDRSNFGTAKSLFAAASADGVDVADQSSLSAWIDEFNARPIDERRQILPDSAFEPRPQRPAVPPVALPDDIDVADAKATAPIVAMFATLAEFVGDGRKLTQTGNLTLADARTLVDLLGTGDVADETIGDRTFKLRSSTELPVLRHVFVWARKAGVVRVAHGRVIATKAGRALRTDLAGGFDRAVDALMAMGPLSSQRDPDGWMAWPEINELLDRFALHLLTGPYVAQRPVPLEDLTSAATSAVLDAFRFGSLTDEQVARHIEFDVIDIIDAFERCGVVRRVGLAEPAAGTDLWRMGQRRDGGSVELTAAGVAACHRLLIAAGFDAPTAGRFATASAADLFEGTDADDFLTFRAELVAWQRHREPRQAAAELAVAVRTLEDPALCNMAFAVLGEMDLAVSGPEVRRLVEEPSRRGFALCWLVDHELEDASILFDTDDVSSFIDVLAYRLATAGPAEMCSTLALAGNHAGQVATLARLWRSPSTATDAVLAAIGDTHPVKIVAKAARKARLQHRSWLANNA